MRVARERQSHVRHELRSPLAVMYPALSMLLDGSAGELTPKQREYLEILERNAERLERYITGATESGWLDCAGAAVEPAAVPLGEVLEEVLAVRRLGGQQGPRIEIGHAPGPRAIAWADREQVRQIVSNLLANAAQYSDSGGVIRIEVSAAGDSSTVSFAVQDQGRGVPADELAARLRLRLSRRRGPGGCAAGPRHRPLGLPRAGRSAAAGASPSTARSAPAPRSP